MSNNNNHGLLKVDTFLSTVFYINILHIANDCRHEGERVWGGGIVKYK